MKRQILVNGLLSLTAVSIMTGCVDDKYDLDNIDKTSRFTVDNLTVPVNLSTIKLENVINLDDNDLIENVNGDYVIKRGGDIAPTAFNIDRISVSAPSLQPSHFSVPSPGVAIPGIALPAIPLPEVDKQTYNFDMNNVDEALKALRNVKTGSPIDIKVSLSVPRELTSGSNGLAFKNLKIQLPWGLITEDTSYDKETGMLTRNEIVADASGVAVLELKATGLDLGNKGEVKNGSLAISGEVGIEGGEIQLTVNESVTLPSPINITADYYVSGFEIASFSGDIDYNMDAISIDPISLNDLPSFLDSPETNLIIANPQILVNITNPVGQWLDGKGKIILTSNFKDGSSVDHESAEFHLSGNESKLAFCTDKADYTFIPFDGLRNVLSNGNSGLPQSIQVKIQDINFNGTVNDFPLGDLGNAKGDYEFNAPLGFGKGSKVIYESTENGWSTDDLDNVNINKIHLKAKCSTNLPVSVQLSVVPLDKYGNEIPVSEDSGNFEVPPFGDNADVKLLISGKSVNGKIVPIKDFDGIRFRAVVEQNQDFTDAIGPELFIELKDLRVTVDGYYETDFN